MPYWIYVTGGWWRIRSETIMISELVMATIDEAVGKEAGAHPLVHSDRGFTVHKPVIPKEDLKRTG